MTYERFLQELGKTPRMWQLSGSEELRIVMMDEENLLCPLTAVCLQIKGTKLSYKHWPEAAEILGLPEALAEAITAAADKTEPYEAGIRLDLLKATGMPE